MAETPEPDVPAAEAAPVVAAPPVTPGFYSLLLMGLVVGMALPWGIWLYLSEPEPSPFEKMEQAIELLHEGRTRTAYDIAMQLLQEGVKDPDIGGNLEYVVGIAHFRKAEHMRETDDIESFKLTAPVYELARQYLEQSSVKTFRPELKPQWAYVLGSCYFQLGHLYEARELLEVAYEIAPAQRDDITLKLAECYLDPNVLQASLENGTNLLEVQRAREAVLKRMDQVLAVPVMERSLSEWESLRLQLFYAELQLQQQAFDKVEESLQEVQKQAATLELSVPDLNYLEDSQCLLMARSLLMQGKTERVRDQLKRLVQEKSGLDQEAILEAHYVIGLAYDRDGRFDLALEHLEKAALMTDTKICFPANLRAGEISRKRGLHEEALLYYLRALEQVQSLDDFTNRWIDLTEARRLVQDAWDEWGSSGRYEHFRFAIELASRVVPLLSPQEANRLTAMATRKRAEIIQAETDALGPEVDIEQQKLARDHWQQAGAAYARLAASLQSTDYYGQNLWEAGLLYRRGNDFVNSLQMIDQFLNTNPRSGVPAGIVLKARLLMDLVPYQSEENIQQAVSLLQKLLRDYPKDQIVYEAQVLLGQAMVESGQKDAAIKIWRDLLLDSALTPAASEWQAAMFSLGRLVLLTSETRPEILLQTENSPQQTIEPAANYDHVDEAIGWLDEFVRRNPDHVQIFEARWLLAKGLRYRIQKPVDELQVAETENLRKESIREIQEYSQKAIEQFQQLRIGLTPVEQREQLDEITSQFLRDAYLEPAHIYYDLGKYESNGDSYRQAIEDYSEAAFHFTGDPVVLIAYYRIAECYRELEAEAEARRQLEQARVVLNQLQDPFPAHSTNFDRQQWSFLLEQSIRLYDLALETQDAGAN